MSGEFPTAAEARAALNSSENVATRTELMTLKTAISKAIEQGKESITVMSMATGVRMYLEERGYKITHMNAYQYSNDQRDTDYWTISW